MKDKSPSEYTEHFLYLHVLAGINNELKEKSTFYDKK